MAGNTERTFIAIMPDAVHRGLIGDIIKRFEQRGYQLIAMKMMHAGEDHLKVGATRVNLIPFSSSRRSLFEW